MLRVALALLLFAMPVCPLARGADVVVVNVADQDGQPAADAVVSLWPSAGQNIPAGSVQRHIIDQHNEAFVPFVTVMRRGDQVQFVNSDRTRHHVYSFSVVKRFELVLSPGERSHLVKFDQAGIAAIGCNIHDKMLAYAFVTETPWVALTDEHGRATIKGVPKGEYRASVWHPRMNADEVAPDQSLDTEGAEISFRLRLTPVRPSNRHQRHY